LARLLEADQIPSREEFRNDIGDEAVSEEDYAFAHRVWEHFACSNMVDYTRLYCRADTLLLAEAVTSLREGLYADFELDLCHYMSLPMMSKDIMLKTSEVEMELIADQEMSHLLRTNIRGGLSFIGTRHAEAHAGTEATAGEPRCIVYLDANNLYGWAMCHSLPLSGFEWMTPEELAAFDARRDVSDRAPGPGYILEVTLRYPRRLHRRHSSFPLAPEQVDITDDMLSPYASDCLHKLTGKRRYRARKLTATFRDRERYLVHGQNLKLYLELGMELVTLHRGIRFLQDRFIKPYIQMCTRKRIEAQTPSEGERYKLCSNSLYGKMIEGVANRMDCFFNQDPDRALSRFSDPLFKGVMIFDEDLTVSFHRKKKVFMGQSWAVGFTVLELSKFVMQRLFYKVIRPRFGGRARLLMSDTDSFVLELPCADSSEAVARLSDCMDFSNYPTDHPLYDPTGKNVLGLLKNEVSHDEIAEFVGVKSKVYAFRTAGGRTESRAKGVKRAYKNRLPFETFRRCVRQVESQRVVQTSIQSRRHQNMLVQSDRVAFTSFDDKRYLLCAVHSVPYGSRLAEPSAKKRKRTSCYFCRHPEALF